MTNKFKEDLPVYLNGFAVTFLFVQTELTIMNLIMFLTAASTFIWYSDKK